MRYYFGVFAENTSVLAKKAENRQHKDPGMPTYTLYQPNGALHCKKKHKVRTVGLLLTVEPAIDASGARH